jgi:hypothetical protein
MAARVGLAPLRVSHWRAGHVAIASTAAHPSAGKKLHKVQMARKASAPSTTMRATNSGGNVRPIYNSAQSEPDGLISDHDGWKVNLSDRVRENSWFIMERRASIRRKIDELGTVADQHGAVARYRLFIFLLI